MIKLKFRLTEYEKYNTKRIGILNANFKIDEECEIVDVIDTEYKYKKVVVKLSSENVDIVKNFEDEVNIYFEEKEIPPVTILYGNKIYIKMKKNLNVNKLKYIKFKSVFVNDENKPFPQLWIEQL